MALGATRWTCRFVGLLQFIMATLTGFVSGILHRWRVSLGTGLMAILALLARCLTCLPSMMAFQAVDLQRFAVFLMVKCDFPHRGIKDNRVFSSESTRDHQTSNQKTCENKHTHQPSLHLPASSFSWDFVADGKCF